MRAVSTIYLKRQVPFFSILNSVTDAYFLSHKVQKNNHEFKINNKLLLFNNCFM